MAIGFNELTSIPQANDLAKFYCSRHFSICLRVPSGIRSGWKAYKKTDGDLQVMSHIMSMVRSKPVILFLRSRLGRFSNC